MAEFSFVEPKFHDVYPFISPDAGLKDAAQKRTILITGAGSGIGKSIAKTFAQASASTVILTGRTLETLEDVKAEIIKSSPNCNVLALTVDVSIEQSVDELFSSVEAKGLRADVLVNNAGVHLDRNSIPKSTPENWWKTWEIMLKGPYLMTRKFMQAIPKGNQSPSAIVNVSSIGGMMVLPNGSSYAISKSALNRLTTFTAAEGVGRNIQAIAYHPGGIPDTGLTSQSQAWMRQFYTETPELAGAVALYLSTQRAGYLSGRYVDARWDLEELETFKDRIVGEDMLKMAVLGSKRAPMSDELMKVIADA